MHHIGRLGARLELEPLHMTQIAPRVSLVKFFVKVHNEKMEFSKSAFLKI